MLRGKSLVLASIGIALIFVISAAFGAFAPLAPAATHASAHGSGPAVSHVPSRAIGVVTQPVRSSQASPVPLPALPNGTANFTQTGLTAGTVWSVTFNGTMVSSNGTTITFHAPNGTYNYTIGGIAGWASTPSSGSVKVVPLLTSAVAVKFVAVFGVTFTETGLAVSTHRPHPVYTWSLVFNGTRVSLTKSSNAYSVANGTYTWATGASTYTATPASGTVTVAGAAVGVSIKFTPLVIVAWTSTFAPFNIVPAKGGPSANFTVTANNSVITPTNTTIGITITDIVTGTINSVFAISAVQAKSTYNFTINYTNLGCAQSNCQTLAADELLFVANVTQNNGTGISPGQAQIGLFIVTILPSGQFVSPLPNRAVGTGNVSLSAVAFGQYVSTANITIYSPSNHAAKIFTANVFSVNGVPASTPWVVNLPGVYPCLMQIIAPYKTTLVWNNITVVQSGQTVYQNSSSYTNATLIPGLSPAVGGTVLLVVGLIIGMLVALLLGRALMKSEKPAAPAQPWTETKAAANTCSTCGKSFATEEELKAHQASEHGMQ